MTSFKVYTLGISRKKKAETQSLRLSLSYLAAKNLNYQNTGISDLKKFISKPINTRYSNFMPKPKQNS